MTRRRRWRREEGGEEKWRVFSLSLTKTTLIHCDCRLLPRRAPTRTLSPRLPSRARGPARPQPPPSQGRPPPTRPIRAGRGLRPFSFFVRPARACARFSPDALCRVPLSSQRSSFFAIHVGCRCRRRRRPRRRRSGRRGSPLHLPLAWLQPVLRRAVAPESAPPVAARRAGERARAWAWVRAAPLPQVRHGAGGRAPPRRLRGGAGSAPPGGQARAECGAWGRGTGVGRAKGKGGGHGRGRRGARAWGVVFFSRLRGHHSLPSPARRYSKALVSEPACLALIWAWRRGGVGPPGPRPGPGGGGAPNLSHDGARAGREEDAGPLFAFPSIRIKNNPSHPPHFNPPALSPPFSSSPPPAPPPAPRPPT